MIRSETKSGWPHLNHVTTSRKNTADSLNCMHENGRVKFALQCYFQKQRKQLLGRPKHQLSTLAVPSRNLQSKGKVEASRIFGPEHAEIEDRDGTLQSKEVGLSRMNLPGLSLVLRAWCWSQTTVSSMEKEPSIRNKYGET